MTEFCFWRVASFEPKEKKYRLIEQDKRMRGKKMRKITFDLTSNKKSLLPKYVQDLVKEMVRKKLIAITRRYICHTST